ncbi:unnamed protein product, partial [Polarella glacialis]
DSKLTRVHAVLRGVQHVAQSSAEKVSGNSRLDDFVAEAQNAADVLGCVATQCREAGNNRQALMASPRLCGRPRQRRCRTWWMPPAPLQGSVVAE